MALPFGPWEPDKGKFNPGTIDIVVNALPLANGWGAFPSPVEFSASLGGECKGAWWFRSTDGTYNTVACTATKAYKANSNGTWTDISIGGGSYTGPQDSDLWKGALFGTNFYITNINDALQVISIDSMSAFVDATGGPPRARYIATVGDYLFLANLKSGATNYPTKWAHSAVNDPTDWTISGVSGDADDQVIPDGDEIQGIVPMAGTSARILQRRSKRALIYSPGSNPIFQQIDIDAPSEGGLNRGIVAPHSIVSLGGTDYFYLSDTGFYVGDGFNPIGAERVDATFLRDIDMSKINQVQAAADPFKKIIWVRYQDGQGVHKMLGWNWQLDRWCYSNVAAHFLVSSVTPGYVLDDLTGVLDDYPDIPVDSSHWQGGSLAFSAFLSDYKLYRFSGVGQAMMFETMTTEINPEASSYVNGGTAKTNYSDITMQIGTATLPSDAITWSSARPRSSRTGVFPFRANAKYHRARLNVAAGSPGTHVHGVELLTGPAGVPGGM